MILSLSHQANLFLTSVLLGVYLFCFYDFFRALRKVKRYKNIQVHIQDLLFVLITTVYGFYTYLYKSNGEIRFYYFIGMTIGGIIYLSTISKYVVLVFTKIMIFIRKVVRRFIKIALIPVKIIYKVTRPYSKIIRGKVHRKYNKNKKYITRPKRFVKRKLGNIKRGIKVIFEKV